MSFYPPTGPGGQPYPPHLYTGPVPAQGPKGRMGGPYPHAHIPQAGGAAPVRSPTPLLPPRTVRLPQTFTPAQFPPNSPPPYGVPPQPELGTSVSPHTQGTPPHSPHAPRVQPHMVRPSSSQIFLFLFFVARVVTYHSPVGSSRSADEPDAADVLVWPCRSAHPGRPAGWPRSSSTGPSDGIIDFSFAPSFSP